MRIITSQPATTAAMVSRPLMPRSCATASAAENVVAPGCEPELGWVRLSISKACASAPLASAADGACSGTSPAPRMRLRPPAPLRLA